MPRPVEPPLPIPTDELRVVTMPNGVLHHWVPIFAEQPENTIMHADGTVLCSGGTDYRDRLLAAWEGYQRRQARVAAERQAQAAAATPSATEPEPTVTEPEPSIELPTASLPKRAVKTEERPARPRVVVPG